MAKQLNVNLAFTADTSKAKAQIQDLQNQLTKVINQPTTNVGADMANKINQASRAAAELKVHLEQAMNPKTGTLDFSKLNQSLQKSGTSLTTYATKLKQIGPEGQKAFSMLAQSVASAEVPIRRSNALLSELWVTMKNTARWQLTSSVLHGFMGALQSAYGYAQDLNESLNNIRIVTGNSVEQMADFAKEANKAAKSLSTSTINYTNAALIYYQQGLNEQQVKERTDITIKMANVSKQSAEVVSDQMTAVWNNFYDGSQSLEHFADVMTRLGADTASSSDEIAQGLEKFASIGEMIGLSFDNAAAALATVTAQTRQSADVVGTAFKTIFARIQGLNLGETLDDGTTLNKYSEALNKVGISIFEQNGELKDMDNILAEMGAKWQTLSKDQQVALAQTVAGVRQYNQLVALMDNYDFYEQNLFSAKNADGSLQEQADIYEESWEAASKRVRASLESIYEKLLNDEAFINLFNNIAKIINGFDAIIDSVGGLKGVLASIAVIVGKIKFDSITSGIQGAVYNIRNTFDGGKAMRQQKVDTLQDMLMAPEDKAAGLSIVERTNNQVITAQLKSQQFLIDNVKTLSQEEQRVLQILMDQQAARSKQAMTAAEAAQVAENRFDEASIMATHYAGASRKDKKGGIWGLDHIKGAATKIGQSIADNNGVMNAEAAELQKTLDRQVEALIKSESLTKNEAEAVREYAKAAKEKARTKKVLNDTTRQATEEINKERIADEKAVQTKRESIKAEEKLIAAKNAGVEASGKNQKKINLSAEGFVKGSMAALSMVSAISMLSSAFDAWKNPDLSFGEKIGSIAMSLTMSIPMLIASFKNLNAVLGIDLGLMRGLISSYIAQNALLKEEASLTFISNAAKKIMNAQDQAKVVNMFATLAVKKGLLAEEQKEAFITTILTKLKKAENAEDVKGILIDTLKTSSNKQLNGQLIKKVFNTKLLNAATLKYVLIAAAVAAAIWAIVYASKAEERALKSAQTGAKNAADAYRELQQAYEDLNQSINDYEDTYKAFQKLEKGAEGYQEALEKSNEAARKLIEANGLFDDWHYDDKGAIVFNDGALDAAKAEAKNKANAASLNAQAANVKYIEAQKDSATPWVIEGVLAETLGSVSSKVFDTVKQAVERGTSFGLKAEDLNLTTEQLSNLIAAVNLLGTNAENVYNQLTKLNQQSEYYAESFALSAAQMNGIYGAEGEKNAQKAYANLIAQDDKYQQQLKDNAEKAKHATDNEIISALYSVNKDTYNSIMKNGIFSDEELARLYMRDVKGWSEQDAAAAVYKGGNGKGTITLGDQSFEYNDQQMRNELLTKYLADQMAQNLGANGEDQAIKDILNLVSGVSNESENGGKTSDGEAELLNSLMNYKEGERISIDWGEMTHEEYTAFMADIEAMSGNAYAEAFNDVLVSEEQQRLMYENAQRQKEAAELESIFAAGAEATGMSEAALESYAESLMEVNEMTDEQRILAAKAAVQHAKLAKGLNKVQDIYNDNIDVLKEADEASLDYHEAVGKLSEALTETFGLEVSPSFVKNADNLELIKKAAEGDVEALQDLRQAINADFVAKLDLSTVEAENALTNFLTQASETAANSPIGTTIDIDNSEAIAAINEALYTGKATIEDIEAMFNNANLAMPKYNTKTVSGEMVRTTSTAHYKGPLGIEWDVTSDTTTTTDRVIPYFGDVEPSDDSGNMNYGGSQVNFSTQGNSASLDNALDYEGDDGSDKGGKKYKAEEDRYHRITKEIEKQERALKRLQTAKENAFGANKLKLIDEEITSLENLKAANEELYRQQQEKLNKDAGAVLSLFPEADFSQGYLSNYNELLMQTTSEEQKKILDQYVKTWDDINNTYDKIIDFENQIKDRKYEDLNYKLELEIEIDDSELKLLELQLSQYEDSFYHLAESAALMSNQGELYKGTLELYKDHWDSLTEKFENQDITQEKYIEGLKNTRDGIYDQLEALIDLDKEMLHFYEDTLSSADDEVDKFMSKMEHLTSVFDHYLNLMDILGKSKDYEAMGNFLGGKADTIKDRLDSASAYYDVLLGQKAEIEAKLNKAIEDEDKAAIELYEKEWDAIVESTNKAQDEVLSLTEEWAEAMKAVVENEMNSLADTLEKSLTKGLGFETLMDNFDKLNTYQEEFLTKTNQMYETSKLMRTANKALDATDNKVAKEKLKNFINETEALQNNTRLSKTELEIQQAKYDLLLAEIALEEAQNAKSTVRLSRDNEGNFGYVYTADENKIADAEQGVADADNKLYNLSLEKQQEYTQKYLQAQQQMYDEMTQLHQDYINGLITEDEYKLRLQGIQEYYYGSAEYNAALEELNRQYHSGQITSEEEYNRKKAELLEKYQGQEGILTVYSSQYNGAVSAHAAAAQDNWQTEYGEMTTNTSDWKIAVNKYLGEVQGATDLWKNTSITANGLVKGALNDSETATKNLKEESSKLKDKLNDEVIPAVGNQLTKVGELTKAYGEQRTELQLLITKYSGYITKLNEAITAASRLASVGGDVETPAPAVTNPTPSGTGSSGGSGSGDPDTTPVTPKPGPNPDPNPNPDPVEQKKWMYMLVLKMDDNAYADKSGYVYATSNAAFKVGDRKAANAGISESVIVKTYQEGETNLPSKHVGMPKGKIGGTMSGENWSNNPYLQESNGYFVQKSALLHAHGFANEKIGKIVYGANVGQGMWLYSSTGLPTHFFNAGQIKEFDTGGYTGKWGPEGKLAMLHQKELVLNAQDTENMLAIVSAVRAIMDSIDVQASWASNGLGMLTAAGYNSMSQNLEQTVTIHAEFPNAANHSEIEEAFNTLINRASQYANRK